MKGERLGNYRILEKIGSGGMGSVYLAKDIVLEREVAIKIISSEYANRPDLMARFKVEAVAQAKLNHPNIITIHSFKQEKNIYYIVMEYVQGKTLKKIISEKGRIPVVTSLKYMTRVISAISYAHSRGVIHRDVKPDNVFITDEGNVKIGDFGIAKIKGIEGLTRTGSSLGTPLYSSPEQILGRKIDTRTDIYSIGITLYEMLVGCPPFTSATSSEYEIQKGHLELVPPKPSKLNSSIPGSIDSIVMKSIEKNPQKRFQSARDFKLKVDNLIRELTLVKKSKRKKARKKRSKPKFKIPKINIPRIRFPKISFPSIKLNIFKERKKVLTVLSIFFVITAIVLIVLISMNDSKDIFTSEFDIKKDKSKIIFDENISRNSADMKNVTKKEGGTEKSELNKKIDEGQKLGLMSKSDTKKVDSSGESLKKSPGKSSKQVEFKKTSKNKQKNNIIDKTDSSSVAGKNISEKKTSVKKTSGKKIKTENSLKKSSKKDQIPEEIKKQKKSLREITNINIDASSVKNFQKTANRLFQQGDKNNAKEYILENLKKAGNIEGKITCEEDKPLINAKIELKNTRLPENKSSSREFITKTDTDGGFVLKKLPAGIYNLIVEAKAFERKVKKNITIPEQKFVFSLYYKYGKRKKDRVKGNLIITNKSISFDPISSEERTDLTTKFNISLSSVEKEFKIRNFLREDPFIYIITKQNNEFKIQAKDKETLEFIRFILKTILI